MSNKRIAVIGSRGAGKTTLSSFISKCTSLPLYHMDELVWDKCWRDIPEEKYLLDHKSIIKSDSWIIDGYINSKMEDRLIYADKILYLNYPNIILSWRLIKRYFKRCINLLLNNGGVIPEESLINILFFVFISLFKNKEKFYFNKLIKKYGGKVVIVNYFDNINKIVSKL